MGWGLFLGFGIGAIAKVIMRRNDPGGVAVTALLGIGGAALAMFLGRLFGLHNYGQIWCLASSAVGAIALLVAYRLTFNRAKHPVRTAPGSSI